ncbi:MAG: GNAT family N-acetyltransferase [Planctomycetes bacterium]|nr:GNAT family N-acetyltransferase [Planctomycetota bacterium]
MASAERIVYRDLRSSDSVAEITELLHEAYRPHAAQGLRYQASYQDEATTRNRLDEGESVVAELHGKIVGTVTLYAPCADSICETYRRPGIYKFGQFAVQPSLQRRGIGLRMIKLMEQRARKCQATHLALDTAEQATHLIAWYARLGFQPVDKVCWPETNYQSVVLMKTLDEPAKS